MVSVVASHDPKGTGFDPACPQPTFWHSSPVQSHPRATHVLRSDSGRSDHVSVAVQNIDALAQLAVSHEAHVADVCAG